MTIDRVKAIAADPKRTREELEQMHTNALARGNSTIADFIEYVLRERFPNSTTALRRAAMPSKPNKSRSNEDISALWPTPPKKRFSFDYCEQHALAVLGSDFVSPYQISPKELLAVDFTAYHEYLKRYSINDTDESRHTFSILFLTSPYRGSGTTEYARLKYISWAARKALGLRATREVSAQKANRRR